MRGIILAGGCGTRLSPLTITANKHLLPVYDKPMIFYPISTLVEAGIKDIMVVTSGPHAGDFLPILKDGKDFGINHLEYAYQDNPLGGIADALMKAEAFAQGESIAVILGDNTMDAPEIEASLQRFQQGAKIFLKKVSNPTQFGVPRFSFGEDCVGGIEEIIEKPEIPPSSYAVIGLYLYDSQVFDFIRSCKPSERGQLEITDVNNCYIARKQLSYSVVTGFWQDAGTPENLYLANKYWYDKRKQS